MQQETEHAPEFHDHDTRVWANFGQLASRWEQTKGLNRNEMLSMLLQGFLCGEMWPTVLPNLYGGVGAHGPKFTASPARPHWMKGKRRFPTETFTRLDFLRAARSHLDVDSRDSPFAAGYRGLIGIPVDQYDPPFIETYIEKLTPPPNAVARWCSKHGWPMPPGLSCSETDVGHEDAPAQTLPPHDEPDPQTDAENVVPQGDTREAEQGAPRSDVTPPLAPVNAETTDIEAEYAKRVNDHRVKTGRRPTFEADTEWRKSKGLKRDTLRDLRQKNRTDKEKKGGHPPRS